METAAQKRITENKNDLIEDTFCFNLFERSLFDKQKCIQLINDIAYLKESNASTTEVSAVLRWIIQGVDQCFVSHKDPDDLFRISNYQEAFEMCWNDSWRKQIKNGVTD